MGSALAATIRERPSLILLTVLLLALLTDAYCPFEITIDVSTVWENFKHIHWLPFVGGPHRVWSDVVVEKGFFFAAIGYLAAINLRLVNVPATGTLAWCLCVVFAAAVEAGKLFFAGRVPNMGNFVLCGVGALLGTFVVRPLSEMTLVRRHSASILIVLVLGLEAYSELSPFDWVSSIDELRGRIATIEWLPLVAYYGADPQTALFDLGKKLFIVGPLGFILASRKRRGRLLAAWVGLISGATLEACQLALRSRTASVTDVLLFAVAAWSGAAVFERFSQIRRSERARDVE
jgi:VanZ family protein